MHIVWKLRFLVEIIAFSLFFVLLYWVADQGPSSTVAFFQITSKILKIGTCNFRIIEKNIKATFRRYFSSLQFDPGEIFMMMIFSRGPRTTYCIACIGSFHFLFTPLRDFGQCSDTYLLWLACKRLNKVNCTAPVGEARLLSSVKETAFTCVKSQGCYGIKFVSTTTPELSWSVFISLWVWA